MSKNTGRRANRPPVSVSQNFLTSAATIGGLLDCVDIRPGDHVVEIGPGKGHFTRQLLRRAGRVTAVEIDPRLHGRLAEAYRQEPTLALVRADFLQWQLPKGPYKVVANVPFNHTTAIVRKLTESKNPPLEAGLLLERGAAYALCGKSEVDARAAMLLTVFEARVARQVPRSAFHPMPSVDAALLHLQRKAQPDVLLEKVAAFGRFVAVCRKGGFRAAFTSRQLAAAFRQAGMRPGATPKETLYIQWLCLFRCHCLYRGT